MNDQRKVIYEQRHELIEAKEVAETVHDMRHQVIDDLVAAVHPREGLSRAVGRRDGWRATASACSALDLPIADWAKEEGIAEAEIKERIDRRIRPQDGAEGRDLRPRA